MDCAGLHCGNDGSPCNQVQIFHRRTRYNCGERFQPDALTTACADHLFESGKQSGESRTASDGDEFQPSIRFSNTQFFDALRDMWPELPSTNGIISERRGL